MGFNQPQWIRDWSSQHVFSSSIRKDLTNKKWHLTINQWSKVDIEIDLPAVMSYHEILGLSPLSPTFETNQSCSQDSTEYIYRISAIFRGVRPWLPVRCPSRQSVELRFFPQAIDHSSDLHPDTLFWHSIIWKYIWLIYFDILSDFFWYSIWHIFWRSIWHLFWHSFWHVLGSMRAQTRHDSLRPTVTTTWQKTNTRRRKD